jgi:hypothetical protein
MAYTAPFTAAEFETFPKFYNEDVTPKLPTLGPFNKGPKEIVAFYSKMFVKIGESLQVEKFVCDDNGICAKLFSTFTAIEDTAEYFGDFQKGSEVYSCCGCVWSSRWTLSFHLAGLCRPAGSRESIM